MYLVDFNVNKNHRSKMSKQMRLQFHEKNYMEQNDKGDFKSSASVVCLVVLLQSWQAEAKGHSWYKSFQTYETSAAS